MITFRCTAIVVTAVTLAALAAAVEADASLMHVNGGGTTAFAFGEDLGVSTTRPPDRGRRRNGRHYWFRHPLE